MLRALVKKQLLEIFQRLLRRDSRSGKKRTRKGVLIFGVLLLLYLAFMFSALAVIFAKTMLPLEMGWFYFLMLGGMSAVFGALGSVFSTCYTLYMAKDNDLLLSMPIPVKYVILSRLLSVYLMGLFYSGMISLPAVIVYWVRGSFSPETVLGGLLLILLISAVVLSLSCMLGWVVAKAIQRLKNRSFLTVLIALALVAVYYYFYFRLMNRAETILDNALRFGRKLRDSAYPVYLLGRIGEGDFRGMLLWTAVVALVMAVIWVVMKRSFLAITTSAPSSRRIAYREKSVRQTNASAALLRKEWFRFSTSANYMLNCGLGLVFLIGFGVYLLIQGRSVLTMISVILADFDGAVPVLLCAVGCVLAGMVDITAPSVSLEGRTIWQIQSMPVTAWQVLRAKLLLHLSVASVPTLFCLLSVMLVSPGTPAQKLLTLSCGVLSMLLIALLGLTLGLKMPNLNWINEVIPIKQSLPVLLTVFTGMGLGLAIGGLYFLFCDFIGPTAYLSVVFLLLMAADAALLLWLRRRGVDRFQNLSV